MALISGSAIAAARSENGGGQPAINWVKAFCAFSYLFFLGAITHVFGGEEGAGSGPLKFLFLPLALSIQLTAIALLAGPKRVHIVVGLLRRNRPLIIALVVICASSVWSIDPELSIRRAAALIGTTAIGLLIYIEVGRERLLRFFAVNLAIFILGSILFALAIPELGTHMSGKFAGDWRGLLTFKNQAAWATVIFLLIWLRIRAEGWMKTWRYPLVALGLVMLFKTGSATGVAAFAFGIAVLWAVSLFSKSRLLRPLILAGTGSIILLVALNGQAFFSSALETLGRDDSLTGRTSVWTALWPLVESRLWLGSGYQAFWDHAAEYFGASSWMVDAGHAHNAYVEILLDVGLIGLVTQLAFLLIVCWRIFSAAARGDNDAAVMAALVLTLAVIGIAGALFFRPNTGVWVMIVAFACYAADSQNQKPVSTLATTLR